MSIQVTRNLAYSTCIPLLGLALSNCGATPAADGKERVGTAHAAVLGPTTWDSSCLASDVPELQRAFALGQVAANSPAFAECLETSLTTFNQGGLPGMNIGPYVACTNDPPNVTAGALLAAVRSMNPTTIACDYGAIGTSTGGDALIGNADLGNSSTAESITLGSSLSYLVGKDGPCFWNPNDPNCAPGVNYAVVAETIFHEVMHQHGYLHVDNNWFAYTEEDSAGHLCGIPYSAQPVYGNGIPYIVDHCLFAVMGESDKACSSMYTGCGEGLSLLDSVYDATPTCSCVEAPRSASVGAPRIAAVTQPSANDYFALDGHRTVIHDRWTASAGFSGWTSLGGTFVSPPVAVAGANGPGTVDVFAEGTNHGYFHSSWDGSTWSSWEALTGIYMGPPAVVSWGPGRIDVFGQGTDRAYYHQAWTGRSTGWTKLEAMGGTFNGPPTAVATSVGSIDIFGRGTDNHYYYRSYDGTSFTPPTWGTVGPGTFVTDPVVAATATRLDIFGQGTDMRYYHQPGIGQKLESLGVGTYIGAPAAAWQGPNTLDVVGQGTNNGYYHLQQSNGVWGPLESTGMTGFGGGTLLVPSSGDLNLYVEGRDHQAYLKDLRGTSWSGVILIPGASLD